MVFGPPPKIKVGEATVVSADERWSVASGDRVVSLLSRDELDAHGPSFEVVEAFEAGLDGADHNDVV